MKIGTTALRSLLPAALCLALGAQGAAGQGSEAAPPQLIVPSQQPVGSGNTVTGRVICADTQRPARFALVSLIPAANSDDDGRGRRFSARTDLDGNFTVANVPAGQYFVAGAMTGYINASQEIEAALNAGGDTSAALPGVPVVAVGTGGAAAQLTLQRGGVIAGTVQWDDGSPAAGVQVMAQTAPTGTGGTSAAQGQAIARVGGGFGAGGFAGAQTDDRGRFRLTGLAAGIYVVRASVQAPAQQRGDDRGFTRTMNLSVYAPDKLRRTEAAAITLAAGEERDDLAITLGLAGLHSVSGVVGSTGAAVRSGTVNLTDQTDSTLNRTGWINADGSFVVSYVPPGNYTLRVSASSQAAAAGGRGGFRDTSSSGATVRFQPVQESVTVTDSDLSGLSVNVAPATNSQ